MQWGTHDWFINKLESQGTKNPGAYFGHRHNGYQRYRHQQLSQWIKENWHLSSGGKLLDVGCAGGELTNQVVQDLDCEAVGIDFVENVIENAKKNYPKIHFEPGSLPSLNFEDDSFDLVIASEVIYYLALDDRIKAMHEINRVLKPGGLVVLSSAIGDKYFTEETMQTLVENCFDVVATHFNYFRIYNKIFTPINFIHNSYHGLYHNRGNSAAIDKRLPRVMRNHRWIYKNPVTQGGLWTLTKLLSPMHRTSFFAKMSDQIGRKKGNKNERHNIIMISRSKKKSEIERP